MPVYELSVSVPINGAAEPTARTIRVSGPYDQHRAKREALQLAKNLPAFAEADLDKATVTITTRQSTEDFVAARRSKPAG